MRRTLTLIVLIAATVAAIFIARGMSGGTNIEKREKYWAKEIAEKLKPGATKEELEAFARDHGQALECYTNYKREPQCDFQDAESFGGSRNLPMRLSVIFALKDGKVSGHEFGTTPAAKSQ